MPLGTSACSEGGGQTILGFQGLTEKSSLSPATRSICIVLMLYLQVLSQGLRMQAKNIKNWCMLRLCVKSHECWILPRKSWASPCSSNGECEGHFSQIVTSRMLKYHRMCVCSRVTSVGPSTTTTTTPPSVLIRPLPPLKRKDYADLQPALHDISPPALRAGAPPQPWQRGLGSNLEALTKAHSKALPYRSKGNKQTLSIAQRYGIRIHEFCQPHPALPDICFPSTCSVISAIAVLG